MDPINAYETIPGPSVVEPPTNLNTDGDAMRTQPDDVSSQTKTNTPVRSDGKNTKKPAEDRKILMKEKKPTTSQMVMEALQALKKRNGASMGAILEYIEGHYEVNAKLVKGYVARYLQSAVQKDVIEQLSGTGQEGRFKIKKTEQKITKVGLKLKDNQKKSKPVRK